MKPETFASLVSAILYEKRLDLFLIFAMYLSYVMKKIWWLFYQPEGA